MDELKARIALLDQCRKDDEEMENKIKPIEDKYAKLQEFEAPVQQLICLRAMPQKQMLIACPAGHIFAIALNIDPMNNEDI